ncbi:hypothetical protein PUN28_002003 [Cardiocondyla obscurior]|uniref:Uncharacterized protein n=1 Tax=Cardiocondyla obscurior TaxID=286306 RepID=A0AAW2GS70_9HYME
MDSVLYEHLRSKIFHDKISLPLICPTRFTFYTYRHAKRVYHLTLCLNGELVLHINLHFLQLIVPDRLFLPSFIYRGHT